MKKSFMSKQVERVYKCLKRSKASILFFPPQVKKNLLVLSQNEESYYVQKLKQAAGVLFLVILLVAFGIVKILFLDTTQTDSIERPRADEQSTEVTLQVGNKQGETEQVYTLEISPKVLEYEEAEAEFHSLITFLETYIAGQNQDTMQITDDLTLPDKVEGYPFDIYWESDKEHLIDNIGNVYREGLEQDEVVTLTAICSYMEYQWEYSFGVCVMQENLSEQALYNRKLEQYLREDEVSQQGADVWELPTAFQGENLQYNVVEHSNKWVVLTVLLLVCGVALWFGSDKDLQKSRQRRQDKFEEEYLGFVTSLSLYISAGLSLQAAMKYCAKDYACKKPTNNVLRVALLNFEKDITNGYSFQSALDRLAKTTDHSDYRQLAGLLQQGLLNGAHDLARTLQVEVDKIREDKRRKCRIRGEKISTALIAPMMLQLCVVIALIMFPAFSNMQF